MDNDLDLDFQSHIILYSLTIFEGVKKGLIMNIIFLYL